jgi:type IV conjugative transfer system protein TraE
MDFLATQHRYENLLKQKNLFVKLSIGLLSVNILQGMERMAHTQKIILVPPQLPTTMWVKGGESSKEYLGEWALYLSSLLLNVSPSTIQGQGDVVLKYIKSDFEGAFKQRLQKEAEMLKKNNTAMSFYPKDVTVAGTKVTVTGFLTTYVAKNEVSKKAVTYHLDFSFGNSDRFVQLANFEQQDAKDVDALTGISETQPPLNPNDNTDTPPKTEVTDADHN